MRSISIGKIVLNLISSSVLFCGCGNNEGDEAEKRASDSIRAIQEYQKLKADSATSADSVAEARSKVVDTTNHSSTK